MKHLKFNTFLLTLLLSMAGITATAHNIAVANEDGVTIYYVWTNSNHTELAVSYRGSYSDNYYDEYSGNVVIPESVTYNGATYPVTSIDGYAFKNCSGLTSVTIGNSVTSIGEAAFSGCSGLTSVTIPNSVTSIGGSAFYGTAWYNNQPDGVVYAGKVAYAYKGKMPANTSISLQEGTLGIAVSAFRGCSSLTSVTIPNSVTSISNSAFSVCSGLTSVTIPSSVTSIGNSAFSYCFGLTSVTIGNSVTSIGYGAFEYCFGLTSVTIPNSVTSIGSSAFYNCSSLESMTVASGNSTYDSRDNCNAIIETASNTLIAGFKNTIIPSSVTSIGYGAFKDCSGLTSVTIPNSVTSIGSNAFEGCSGLTSVTIPNSVTRIGELAFSSCSGLESMTVASGNSTYDSRANCNAIIETASNTLIAGCKNTIIPSSVTSIGSDAFRGCSGLTDVTIPNSVTSIGDLAFSYCSGLTDVFCYAENVPTTSTYAFNNSPISSATLHVLAASLSSYQSTAPWSGFGNIVGDIVLKCATPTIAFVDGILTFECETEGVEFVNTITASVDESSTGNNVPLPELKTTYHVSVYAVKEGYVNSDVATMDIDFQPKTGDVNGDGEVTIADAVAVVDIILNSPSAAP